MKEFRSNIQYQLAAKEMRDGKRYKQIEIAQATGLSHTMISRLINSPTLEHFTFGSVAIMAEWLGCTLDDLMKKETTGN
jgi:transcriptional regulator with XRE-family HTH domain